MGAIGESLVVAKLMQQGWDAFNANCTIKNYKSIDIICLNSDLSEDGDLRWKPKTALVQVKLVTKKHPYWLYDGADPRHQVFGR